MQRFEMGFMCRMVRKITMLFILLWCCPLYSAGLIGLAAIFFIGSVQLTVSNKKDAVSGAVKLCDNLEKLSTF
jgi:hypothetical protein